MTHAVPHLVCSSSPAALVTKSQIDSIESEIDAEFADSELLNLPYAQRVWTLLSVVEDHHFKFIVHSPLSEQRARAHVDALMNELTYPMRVCHAFSSTQTPTQSVREMNNEHYIWASEWLERAESYLQFASIFPLFRTGQIGLVVEGDRLATSDWRLTDLSYEVYDRFTEKRDPQDEQEIDPNEVAAAVLASLRMTNDAFSVDFTRRLVQGLQKTYGERMMLRHRLPSGWKFSRFSLQEYRDIFVCLQSIAHGWFLARQIAVQRRIAHFGYKSSVWTPRKGALVAILSRSTGHSKQKVSEVLRYITFGEMGVRNPDVAIQPLFDLGNGQYAVSPFLIIHTNAERNLCVLLNQIPEELAVYSRLVDQKEDEARSTLIQSLQGLGLEFRHGQLAETDIDLALIDRNRRKCLCIEIKWFIEPAEIREVANRSKEIKKGISQAVKIRTAFERGDSTLLELLGIDAGYDLLTMVGSDNSIGGPSVQDATVPVTKLWHLAAEIRRAGSLEDVFAWLRSRAYLPTAADYRVVETPIQVGKWHSSWYAIDYLHDEPGWKTPEAC